MKELFDSDSLPDCVDNEANQEEQERSEFHAANAKSHVKSAAYMRKIEIMRENKLLQSSINDIYDF